jgi:hypothetical protein
MRKGNVKLPDSTMDPEGLFQTELDAFREDVAMAGQFFYAFLAVHATAGTDKRVHRL